MKFTLLFILSFLVSTTMFSVEKPKAAMKTVMISGKILDSKNSELLAGVKIECEACQKVMYTDLDGRFFVYLQVDATQDIKLEITQVGYLTKTLNLKDISGNSGNLEINLISE